LFGESTEIHEVNLFFVSYRYFSELNTAGNIFPIGAKDAAQQIRWLPAPASTDRPFIIDDSAQDPI
jgi:hypothetical protein